MDSVKVLLCFSVDNRLITCELMNVSSSDVIVSNMLDKSGHEQCIKSGNKGRHVAECNMKSCLRAQALISTIHLDDLVCQTVSASCVCAFTY